MAGTSGRNNNRKKYSGRLNDLPILLCIFLVAAAVLAAFFLTSYFVETNMSRSPLTEPAGQTSAAQEDTDRGTGSASLSLTVPELIYVFNPETGGTEQIFLSVLDCTSCELTMFRIDPEISYTMSGGLYASLTPGNAELSQTVTFRELYRYYHSDSAFPAGLKIISEMLNVSISSYTVIPDYVFGEFISVDPDDDECRLCVEKDYALNAYGTPGSTRGIIEAGLKDSFSTVELSARLRYLEVYDALDGIIFINAPVTETNERTVLDDSAARSILYSILYPAG